MSHARCFKGLHYVLVIKYNTPKSHSQPLGAKTKEKQEGVGVWVMEQTKAWSPQKLTLLNILNLENK